MTGVFYGVLGVGPDADEQAIRHAYRERVKEHHPDVSSDPRASERFKRLTAARETLTDDRERALYDRVGHDAYVKAHLDCPVWDGVTDGLEPKEGERGESGNAERGESGNAERGESGNAERGESGNEERGESGDDQSDPSDGSPRSRSERHEPDAEPTAGNGSATGSTGGVTASSPADCGAAGATNRRSGRHTTASGGTYAETSFWNAHGPGDGYSGTSRRDPLAARLGAALRALGPWVVVHAVFLTIAIGSCWYAITTLVSDPSSSLPFVFLMIAEACLAVFLSVMHVLSRIYR